MHVSVHVVVGMLFSLTAVMSFSFEFENEGLKAVAFCFFFFRALRKTSARRPLTSPSMCLPQALPASSSFEGADN